MTFAFTPNLTPTTGCDVWYQWKLLLKGLASAWLVKSSSDGTTYNASGDQITGANAGANGWQNSKAWVRIQSPGGKEYVIQRSTASNAQWRIKLSVSATFVGGSPSATQVPSATDEVVLCGGGTDAAPTFNTILGTDGTYRCQIGADGAAPSGFFYVTYPSGGGTPNGGFMMDPLSPVDASDPDPYVYYLCFNSAGYKGSTSGSDLVQETGSATVSGVRGYMGATATAANFVAVPSQVLWSLVGSLVIMPNGTPVSPFSGKDADQFLVYVRRAALAAPVGWKGVSTLLKWHSPVRSSGDTANTKARLIVGEVELVWDSTTTPLV